MIVQTQVDFVLDQPVDILMERSMALGALDLKPYGAALGSDPLGTYEHKSTSCQEVAERSDHEIGDVLVIDDIQECFRQHVDPILGFDDDESILRQQVIDCTEKAVEVIDVSDSIIRNDDVSSAVLVSNFYRELGIEEFG